MVDCEIGACLGLHEAAFVYKETNAECLAFVCFSWISHVCLVVDKQIYSY